MNFDEQRDVGFALAAAETAKYKYLPQLCAATGLFLFLRAFNGVFLYPAVLLGLAAVLIAPPATVFCFLFFAMPSGLIIKENPNNFSFFTLMFLVASARFLATQKNNSRVLIGCLIYAAYLLILSGLEQIIAIITIALGLFLVYYALKEELDLSRLTLSYAFGVALASVISLTSTPIVNNFVRMARYKAADASYINRFSGLHGNPNYYTLDVILALTGLTILILTRKRSAVHLPLFGFLTILGFMAISKSFVLAWVFLLAWILASLAQARSLTLIAKLLLGGVVCFFASFYFAGDSLNALFERFLLGQGASFGEQSTGRGDIWGSYLAAIWSDVKILAFGVGVGGPLIDGFGAHNTYLEMFYTVGVLGAALFAHALWATLKGGTSGGLASGAQIWRRRVFAVARGPFPAPPDAPPALREAPPAPLPAIPGKPERRKLIRYAPLLVLLLRLCGISIFLNDTIWFYIIFVVAALQDDKRDVGAGSEA